MVNVDVIKNKATAMGLTLAALERRADLGNGVIGRWETSQGANVDTLLKVANVLNCTVDELLIDESRVTA